MKKHRLTTDAFYNKVRHLGNPHKIEAIVKGGGLEIEGHRFKFIDEGHPVDGETVLFWMSNWGYAYVKSEYDAYQKERIESLIREKEADRLKALERKQKADDFYKSLNFPVAYHVGVKEVLSGLSASSWGDGQKRNSAIHLILDEDFESGRLKRQKREFLCSQQKQVANWSGQNDSQLYAHHGRDLKWVPEITCKQCLKKLDKYIKREPVTV